MARRYWAEIDGQRIYRDTLGAIKRIAQDTADKLGRVVRVGYEDPPAARRNPARARPRSPQAVAEFVDAVKENVENAGAEFTQQARAYTRQAAQESGASVVRVSNRVLSHLRLDAVESVRRSMRRNPDPGSFLPVWVEQEKGRAMRLKYLAATKARRLAKGLRGRDRGGAVKAAERRAEKTGKFAVKARNAKEAFTLFRASRGAADALGAEFEAAGYKVTILPV
jgi:hypothetical protein